MFDPRVVHLFFLTSEFLASKNHIGEDKNINSLYIWRDIYGESHIKSGIRLSMDNISIIYSFAWMLVRLYHILYNSDTFILYEE